MIFFCRLLALATAAAFCAQSARATDLPLSEDFEDTAGGFTPSSATWKWGVPSTGPGSAHSGTQAWGTNLTGNYQNDEDAVLTSSDYNLTAFAGKWIVVHWWQSIVTEAGYDDALVEVSKDSGGTWETVFGPRSGVVSASWTQQTVLLDPSYATANFRIRFRVVSDSLVTAAGFYVDDLRISATSLTERVALESFETGDGGYAGAGVNSTWELGTPITAPGGAHSGLAAWATGLNGFYAASENSALTSPSYDLTAAAGELIVISWWQFIETEEGFDFTGVELSKDGGATWAPPLLSATDSGPVTGGMWARKQAFADPSYATAAFRIRFKLDADENFQFNGYAIDDIAIHSTGGLFPVASGFTRSTPMDLPLKFTAEHFLAAYTDPDGSPLTAITIEQIPAGGVLVLAGNPVTAGQEIPLSQLGSLVYSPAPGASGPDPFTWTGSNHFGASAPATVAVTVLGPTPEVVIATSPEGKTVNPGTSVTFEVVALSTTALTYQWRRNQETILGANGATYTIGSVTEDHEGSYDVVVTNAIDEEISASASLSVNDPVTIVTPPVAFTVNEGGDAEFSVGATGTGRLDYQWLKNNEPIPDATFAVLPINDATPEDAASYACVVTNVVGSKTTTPVALTVRLAPRIIVHPISIGKTENGWARFEVQAEGFGTLTYQWLKDGEELPGATSSVLILKDLLPPNAGSYTVRVSNSVATVESDEADLSVFFWRQVAGTYQDVLELQDADALNQAHFSGRVTASVNVKRTVTAVVEYEGLKYRLKGYLNPDLIVEKEIKRPSRSNLSVRLKLQPEDFTVAVTISHDEAGVIHTSEGILPKRAYHPVKNRVVHSGRYNVCLNPAISAGVPNAPAFLVATISRGGAVRVTGVLPDGSRVSGGARLDPFGRVPFYRSLYAKTAPRAGHIAGRLAIQVGDGNVRTMDGTVVWRKPDQRPGAFLPTAFLANMEVEGSLYQAPARRQPVLPLPIGVDLLEMNATGPLPGGAIQRWVRVSTKNIFFVDPATAERIRFKVNPATGFVTGSYTDTTVNKQRKLQGVTLQAQGEMRGFFLGDTDVGAFTLVPYLP